MSDRKLNDMHNMSLDTLLLLYNSHMLAGICTMDKDSHLRFKNLLTDSQFNFLCEEIKKRMIPYNEHLGSI